MRALIIHQNFPGQFVHVASALADNPQNEVVAIGDARTLSKRPAVHPKIRVLAYEAPEGGSASTHPYLRDHEGHVRRGQVVLRMLMQLKASGWTPDLILAHPGWGEGLVLKDAFPDARVLQYKPGILLSPELVDEILDRTEIAIGKAYAEWKAMSRQAVTA